MDADERRTRQAEFVAGITELETECETLRAGLADNPNLAVELGQAERSLHQLKAMWFWTETGGRPDGGAGA